MPIAFKMPVQQMPLNAASVSLSPVNKVAMFGRRAEFNAVSISMPSVIMKLQNWAVRTNVVVSRSVEKKEMCEI